MKIKVYAKLDNENVIQAITSSIFLHNLEGWILIDEGEGNKYAHAQSNYLPKSLFDNYGRYNYKYENGIVELTQNEKETLFPSANKPIQKELLEEMMKEEQTKAFLIQLPDEKAVKIPLMYDAWNDDKEGTEYAFGDRREHGGKLYKCRQAHSKAHYTPDTIPALWEVINETHSGTIDDPIPYDTQMTVFNGKYYLEEGIKYLCVRDSGQPLYANCSALVGNYFEVV